MPDYKQILQDAGYPTDVVCLDFETYFDVQYTLSKMSTIEYIHDDRFEFTGLGEQWVGESPRFIVPDGITTAITALKNLEKLRPFVVLVQNARFDITILQTKFGWVPKYIVDLKDLAAHYDSRMSLRLKDLATTFGLPHKGDTMQFKGVHWKGATREQRMKWMVYTIGDVVLETDIFEILLPKLTNTEMELQLMRHTLDLWLWKRLGVDQTLGKRIAKDMKKKLNDAIEATGHTIEELRSADFAGYVASELNQSEQVPMKKGKKGLIPALAKTDDGCKWLQAHPNEKVRNLINARLMSKSWPTHIKRVNSMCSQAEVNGKALRVPLNYYGGHTGRWSGGEGINLQNLGGRGRAGEGNDPLIGEVRSMLTAPNGYVFGIADSAQIEARMVAWLAGCEKLSKGFANGEDVYSELATKLFGVPIRKPKKTDPAQIQKFLEIKRGFGKDAILGAGYGMGPNKFYTRCLQNTSLRPYFDNGTYTESFIATLISVYKNTYPEIPMYWTSVETAFKRVIRFPHLSPVQVGCCSFSCVGSEVRVTLPSGRVLYYRHCSLDRKNSIKYQHGALWGGSITENIDQAISRDLLAWWILECEKAGLPVVLHVHDEIVTILPESNAEVFLKLQTQIMKTVPSWADGFPVDAEAKLSKVYCK